MAKVIFNFKRCQRPDGSIYGTSGQCRKGTEIGDLAPQLPLKSRFSRKQDDPVDNRMGNIQKKNKIKRQILQLQKEKAKTEALVAQAEADAKNKALPRKQRDEAKERAMFGQYQAEEIDKKISTLKRELEAKVIKPDIAKGLTGYDPEEQFNKNREGKVLGEGVFGKVKETKGPPPGIVKYGRIGENEAEALKILGEAGVTPQFHGLIQKSNPYRPDDFSTDVGLVSDGYLGMGKAKGITLGDVLINTSKSNPASAEELTDFSNEYIRLRKEMHLKGVAHNDMHLFNVFYDKNGGNNGGNKATVVDLGMAKISYKAALAEAIGSITGADWQFDYARQFLKLEELENPKYLAMEGNFRKMKKYLRSLGFNSEPQGGIRLPKGGYGSILESMSESELKKALEIFYEGV